MYELIANRDKVSHALDSIMAEWFSIWRPSRTDLVVETDLLARRRTEMRLQQVL